MDIGTKKNLIFVAKWIGFWGTIYLLDTFLIGRFFDTTLISAIIENPSYSCLVILAVWAMTLGEFEARFYHYKSEKDKNNEHPMFAFSRLLVFLLAFIITDWKFTLCYMAMFPFFHDGAYYTQRNYMNHTLYAKKWFAQSTTSTALTTRIFTPIVRTILAALAIGTIITLNII